MAHVLLLVLVALAVGAVAYGVTWVITGRDRGLDPAEPDGRAVPLPSSRPLSESDIETIRFDTVLRGYRMDQVDAALRRTAYDLGYKDELIDVLEAEIEALRSGRLGEADEFRDARQAAQEGHSITPRADEEPEPDGYADWADPRRAEDRSTEDPQQEEPAESPAASAL